MQQIKMTALYKQKSNVKMQQIKDGRHLQKKKKTKQNKTIQKTTTITTKQCLQKLKTSACKSKQSEIHVLPYNKSFLISFLFFLQNS